MSSEALPHLLQILGASSGKPKREGETRSPVFYFASVRTAKCPSEVKLSGILAELRKQNKKK